MLKNMKKTKIPTSFQWIPDPREQQKIAALIEYTGITSGTQLIQAAIARWYNEIKNAYYNQKHGPQFGSAGDDRRKAQ